MGLFDKKYCDVCGEKIGLLGNKKLEDGNLCKDCAKKLSPFFSERRSSTVAEIKEQLAYREENEKNLASFRPTRTFGRSMKVYIDDTAGKFIATYQSDWRSANPDIIDLSQVTSCNLDVHEDRDEIYYRDDDGNRKSYSPPRYKYEYKFNIVINVNSPWFSQIKFELSDIPRPDSRYTEIYREYERQGNDLCSALMRRDSVGGFGAPQPQYGAPQQQYTAPQQQYTAPQPTVNPMNTQWTCPFCQSVNSGKFCENCGAPKQNA